MKFLGLVLLLVIIPSFALGEEIHLKSGVIKQGEIVEKTDKSISLNNGKDTFVIPFRMISESDVERLRSLPTKIYIEQVTDIKSASVSESVKVAPAIENTSKEFIQQDGLFKISLLEGWRGQEMPGRVVIFPPHPRGNGIVIQYKPDVDNETKEVIKKRISASLDNIVENKIKPIGGTIIENKEILIDGVFAQYLLYSVSLKGESMYFLRMMINNKGYNFSIDYGDPDRLEVDKALTLLNTWRF